MTKYNVAIRTSDSKIEIKETAETGNSHLIYLTGTRGFITEWTVSGDATARTITLPLVDHGTFNCTVNWGDGSSISTITTYNDADRIHTYSSNGVYNVEIQGECPGWNFNDVGGTDYLKITDIIYWGDPDKFGGFEYLCALESGAFNTCSNLKTTGSGKILVKNTLTNLDFLFYECSSITTINNGLFDNCVNVTEFQYTFGVCTSLVTIPRYLFDNCINATSFYNIFASCSSLVSGTRSLFLYNTLAVNFTSVFADCVKLQVDSSIFGTDTSTRFLNQSVDFTSCFYRTSFSGTQGTAPDLWNFNFGTGTPTKLGCFGGAGNSLTSLTNYGDIPNDWK